MSECVVRMKMPKRCYECDLADGVTCMATGGVYGREVPKMIWIRRRPEWCPIICPLPEGHGRLVDADALKAWFFRPYSNEESYCNMDVAKAIDKAPTIVPAEAERSET